MSASQRIGVVRRVVIAVGGHQLWLAMNLLNRRQLEGANPLAPPDIRCHDCHRSADAKDYVPPGAPVLSFVLANPGARRLPIEAGSKIKSRMEDFGQVHGKAEDKVRKAVQSTSRSR